jgi:hypothetical protein
MNVRIKVYAPQNDCEEGREGRKANNLSALPNNQAETTDGQLNGILHWIYKIAPNEYKTPSNSKYLTYGIIRHNGESVYKPEIVEMVPFLQSTTIRKSNTGLDISKWEETRRC